MWGTWKRVFRESSQPGAGSDMSIVFNLEWNRAVWGHVFGFKSRAGGKVVDEPGSALPRVSASLILAYEKTRKNSVTMVL